MAVTQYVGARYVPLFSEPLDWDITKEYEPLTIVYYAGNSYTSRQAVPKNIEITNEDYWALTGNYNAQIEQYRKEVQAYDAKIKANTTLINNEASRAKNAEKVNSDAITTEKARALAAEKVNSDAIATEKARALAAEKVNSDAIATEKARALAAEKNLSESTKKLVSPVSACSVLPVRNGSIRICTFKYDKKTTNDACYWPQGLGVDDSGNLYQAVIANDESKSKLYKRESGSDSFKLINGDAGITHGSSVKYVPALGKLIISKGKDGVIFICNASTGAKEKTITVGTGCVLVAYDKKTKKVYLCDDYGESVSELSTDGKYTVTPISAFSNGFAGVTSDDNQKNVLQDMAAYDGSLFVLYSTPTMIARFSLDNKLTGLTHVSNDDGLAYVGEAEGIDVASDGTIFFSSFAAWERDSFGMTRIWTVPGTTNLMKPNNQGSPINGKRNSIVVAPSTETNLLAYQTPDGSSSKPFVCLNEALEAMRINPGVFEIIVLDGYHRREHCYITAPNVAIVGKTGKTADNIGSLEFVGSVLKLSNFNLAPLSDVTYIVDGSNNGGDIYYTTGSNGMGTYLTDINAPSAYIATRGTVRKMDSLSTINNFT